MTLVRQHDHPYRLPELPDPFTPAAEVHYAARRARRLLGQVKRRFRPSPARAVPPPVIGYARRLAQPAEKRALIAYLTAPFHQPAATPVNHSCYRQAVAIADVFNTLGYVVDIVDWHDETFVPSRRYDVLFGELDNYTRMLPYMEADTVRIYYGTRACGDFEDAAYAQRCADLAARRGGRPPRVHTWWDARALEGSDAVIAIGNAFDAGTYARHGARVFAIDNSTLGTVAPAALQARDFDAARRHFLWFGSQNLLHKGLDLALEVFRAHPDLHLWVCGPLQEDGERWLLKRYRQALFHTPNIHPIGWVDVHSPPYAHLVERCAYLLFPSCSEAMAGAVLTCLGRGLVPLVSAETGLDVEGFGWTFPACTVEAISERVQQAAAQPAATTAAMAEAALQAAATRYTMENYTRTFTAALAQALAAGRREGRR